MATFCTKCGAPVSAEKNFCTACGAPASPASTPVPGAAALPAPPPLQPCPQQPPPAYTPTPAYAPPPAGYAPPPAASPVQGGSALKIILIIVAVLVGLALIGILIFALGIWRVTRAVHVHNSGDGVTISTPGGDISAGNSTTLTEADLGVPIYPGAARNADEGGLHIRSTNGSMVTGVYTTGDSPAQVIAFYKSKMSSDTAVIETGQGAILTSGKQGKESVVVTISTDTSDNKTKIAVMHTRTD